MKKRKDHKCEFISSTEEHELREKSKIKYTEMISKNPSYKLGSHLDWCDKKILA